MHFIGEYAALAMAGDHSASLNQMFKYYSDLRVHLGK